ncbi:HET-domain-containing protein [Colletotrichum truncatum]|uniref:HET-domain-containing protein n=1 Tax=Colletotrichum truncatum TaxID=5467 RepID=A0ACC3YY94_COLTU|nr:HET-domain-containing protein [Colletotrichum truncatum]KAF6790788.1 HET-domain-containing protein [Colletotrichum truncatum]
MKLMSSQASDDRMEPYHYEDLNLDRPAFRLVRLFKGDDGDRLRCELFQAFLDERDCVLPYEALSYTWGSTTLAEEIETNGKSLGITNSLYAALHRLRYRDKDRILWVDGICINQSNPKERGHQVLHMGYIYKQADRVVFWLGYATYDTNVFMESVKALQEESMKHTTKDWKLDDPRWREIWEEVQPALRDRFCDLVATQREGLVTLLSRLWFTRVWILQEVANAPAALIYCGPKSVSARLLALTPILLGVRPERVCQAVLDIMPGPSRKETWWAKQRDLYFLLQYFGSSQATEPRDIIYALRGLSTDANDPEVLAPDYAQPVSELIRKVSNILYYCDVNRFERTVVDIPDLVQRVKELNSVALGELLRTSKKREISLILDRGGIAITKGTVGSALENEKDGLELLRSIFGYTQYSITIPDTAVAEIARQTDAKTMDVLLRHRIAGCLQTDTLVCAALNEQHGPDMVDLLLPRYRDGKLDPEVLVATFRNSVSGYMVVERILKYSKQFDLSLNLGQVVFTICDPQKALLQGQLPVLKSIFPSMGTISNYSIRSFMKQLKVHGIKDYDVHLRTALRYAEEENPSLEELLIEVERGDEIKPKEEESMEIKRDTKAKPKRQGLKVFFSSLLSVTRSWLRGKDGVDKP